VFVLQKLSIEECQAVLRRALAIYRRDEQLESDQEMQVDEELLLFLAGAADGDARVALSTLELALKSGGTLSKEHLRESLLKAHLQYDRTGDNVGRYFRFAVAIVFAEYLSFLALRYHIGSS
jgi:putative ATPase